VYDPYNGDAREEYVQWIIYLNNPPNEDWLIVVDFTFIRSPKNRNKPRGNVNDILIFNNFIRASNLTELPLKGNPPLKIGILGVICKKIHS
jgi:hypothetical protein